jgi:cell division protein FtsL
MKEQFTIGRKTVITFSASFLLMLAGALVTATVTFNDMRNQIHQNQIAIHENKTRLAEVEQATNEAKVSFGQIQTELKNINLTMLEIKAQLQRE